MKKQPKKLVLAKETLQNLTPELRLAAGGFSETCLFGCTVVSNPFKCFSPPSNNC